MPDELEPVTPPEPVPADASAPNQSGEVSRSIGLLEELEAAISHTAKAADIYRAQDKLVHWYRVLSVGVSLTEMAEAERHHSSNDRIQRQPVENLLNPETASPGGSL